MKYTPSALVSEFSGSQGSTTASHNRFGPYFRNRTIPVNPNTATQQNARNSLKAAAQGWTGLSTAARLAWNAAASVLTLVDRLGRTYHPSGFQYYMSVNRTTYVYSGSTAITATVPTSAIPATLLTLTPTLTLIGGVVSLAYTATPLAASTKAIIEATPQLSAGVGFIKPSLYRQILVTAAAAASPAVATSAYAAKFGTLISGKQIGVRVTIITSDGNRSAPLAAVGIVS